MSWRAVVALVMSGCAPLVAGTARVLPVDLQADPASLVNAAPVRAPPRAELLVLRNGLEVSWVNEPGAPLTTVTVYAACGRSLEPVGAAGVTQLMWAGAFVGGTRSLPRDRQVARHALLALAPDIGVDDEVSMAAFSVLPEVFPEAMRLVGEALFEPLYDEAAMAGAREDLARRAARREVHLHLLRRVLASKQEALTQPLEVEGLRTLRGDVIAAHARRCFQPANLVLGISGPLDVATMRTALEPLAEVPRGERQPRPAPLPAARGRAIWLSPESTTRVVEVTILARTGPLGPRERATGRVLMATLAGSLSSELREQFGYAYAVRGDLEGGAGFGVATLTFSTRREAAYEAVRRATGLLDGWWAHWPISPAEAERLRAFMAAAEARSPSVSLASEMAFRRLVDGPDGEPAPTATLLREVTSEQMLELFIEAFAPVQRQVLVQGDFDPTLSWAEFGQVMAP